MTNTKPAPDPKQCSRCKHSKPLAEFYRMKNGYYRSWCRACDRVYSRAYYHRSRQAASEAP